MESISIWDANFVVIDVETTGNNPRENRIMDIAAVNLNNHSITKEYSSQVNPHQFIPPFITQMTKITNEQVFYAPENFAVMPKIASFFKTQNVVFVAHNANFDFSFVNESMKRAKLDPLEVPVLDTLKLARRLLADSQKKNVGNLAHYFGIRLRNRHSAMGDAKATAKVLLHFLEIAEEEHEITTLEELLSFQNKKLSYFTPLKEFTDSFQDKLSTLPDTPGVYYFMDKRKKIIYVGKAKSLKNRVSSYFQPGNITSYKLKELTKSIADLKWEETYNELSALLLESKEIKKYEPKFNFVGLRLKSFPFLILTTNEKYPRIDITYNTEMEAEYYGPFLSKAIALEIKDIIDKNFQLVKCDLDFNSKKIYDTCLFYQISECLAPCALRFENDFDEKYRKEVEKVRQFLSGFATNLFEKLKIKMENFSEKLEFEKAQEVKQTIEAASRIFNNSDDYINSINDQNFIMVMSHQSDQKFNDIFLFRYNKLMYHQTIGKKNMNNNELIEMIGKVYFNGTVIPDKLSLSDIEEMKITNSWLAKNKENGEIIYIDSLMNKERIIEKISKLNIEPIELM